MPTYDYTCVSCKHEFEAMSKIANRDKASCELCGSHEVTRGVGYSGHFKIDGYCAKNGYTGLLGNDEDYIKQYGKQKH